MLRETRGARVHRILKALVLNALVALALAGASTTVMAQDWVFVDGQLVKAGQSAKLTPLVPGGPKQVPPTYKPKPIGDLTDVGSLGASFVAQLADAARVEKARAEAKEVARVEAEKHPGKTVVVSVIADRPPRADASVGSSAGWARFYTVGAPEIYDSKEEALHRYFGAPYPEIKVPGVTNSERKYLADAFIGQSQSGIPTQVGKIGLYDVEQYKADQARREADIARVREEDSKKELEKARLAEEAAKKKADAEKAEQAKKKLDLAKKTAADAAAKAKHTAEVQAELNKMYKERDAACADGMSMSCIQSNERIIKTYDDSDRYNATAKCMQVEPDQIIQGGVCGKGSPPCINCSVTGDFYRQDMIDRNNGNALFIADKLNKNSAFGSKFSSKILDNYNKGVPMGKIVKAIEKKN